MSKIEFIKQIDWALANFQMSPEMREFLNNLKSNVPDSECDRYTTYTEWMEMVMMTINILAELSKYT